MLQKRSSSQASWSCTLFADQRPLRRPIAHWRPEGLSHQSPVPVAVLASEKAAFSLPPPPLPLTGSLPGLSRPPRGVGGQFLQLSSVPSTAARLWVAGAQLAPHGGAVGAC